MVTRRLLMVFFVYVGLLIAAPAFADGFVTPSIGATPAGTLAITHPSPPVARPNI